MWTEAATRVGTLTVCHPAGAAGRPSPTALRLAVTGQLTAADLLPGEVPPSSVLVVRRLADPMPGRLAPRPGTVRTDPAWEAAVRSRLAELHRFASRPADGAVPPSAAAVCFRDRAELLACLARDLVAGGRDAWWWRAVRRGLPTDPASLLAEHPRELPAIIARLVEMGAVSTVLSALDRDDAGAILAAVVEAHRLDAALLPEARRRGRESGRMQDRPPWAPWLSTSRESAGELPTVEHSALVGIALGLAHRPAEVRSAQFVAEVRGFWRRADATASSRADPAAVVAVEESASPVAVEPARHVSDGGSDRSTDDEPQGIARPAAPKAPAPWLDAVPGAASTDEAQFDGTPSGELDDQRGVEGPKEAPRTAVEILPDDVESESHLSVDARVRADGETRPEPRFDAETVPATVDRADVETDPIDALADGVVTALGGVLYLVNALSYMPHVVGEAGDEIGSIWTRSHRVGGWGILELAARGLLVGIRDQDSDPIWTALATLDGREPGQEPEHEPWLDDLLPKLRDRLAEALDEGSWRPELATELFAIPGRLFVTRTHVDLVVPIDHISLRARRAGLDRDPGWVPELGRVVLFHFR